MTTKNGNLKVKKTIRKNARKQRRGIQNISGITQNVGVSVGTPFGDNAAPKLIAEGLDAFSPCHVPLPRATGGYTTIRTTAIISSSAVANLFGPVAVKSGTNEPTQWSTICGLSSVNAALGINAANNCQPLVMTAMAGSGWNQSRVTPAAFSLQLMNPEAVQTTNGIVYVGRAKQMLDFGGDATTWDAKMQELVSYSNPRLCSAAKLAFRGTQTDLVPGDMNSLADFRQISDTLTAAFSWDGSDGVSFDGFMPMFVYNPNQVALQFLVCCEWRVRFDPGNPAYASHRLHKASTPGYWERVLEYGEAMGNGVIDIAQKVGKEALLNAARTYMTGKPHITKVEL